MGIHLRGSGRASNVLDIGFFCVSACVDLPEPRTRLQRLFTSAHVDVRTNRSCGWRTYFVRDSFAWVGDTDRRIIIAGGAC
jgi:hypothetical protein